MHNGITSFSDVKKPAAPEHVCAVSLNWNPSRQKHW